LLETILGLGVAHAVDGTFLRCGEDVGDAKLVAIDDNLLRLLRRSGRAGRQKEQESGNSPGKERPKHEGLREQTGKVRNNRPLSYGEPRRTAPMSATHLAAFLVES